MATTTHETGRYIALGEIRVPENVRALDSEHVKALAGSIKVQGMLVPVVVRDDSENGFELVAGFHRIAAARSLGLADVPVVVRDVQTEDADRAVENITSCRRRHDVTNADGVVMPTSVARRLRFATNDWRGRRNEPVKNPGGQAASAGRAAEVPALLRVLNERAMSIRAMRSRFVASERDLSACRCNHARKEERAGSVGGGAPEC